MSSSKQLQFIKGSAVLILSNMVIKGINFLLLPLYTKYLTPKLLGISDTITTLTSMLFLILVMGLDSAFSAFYFDERTELYKKKVFNTICLTLFCVSIIPILMAVGSKYISLFMFGKRDYFFLVTIAMASVSINLWYLPFSIYVRMENRMTIFAIINFIASISMILLNVVFLSVFKIGVYSLITSTTVINLIQFGLYLMLGKIRPQKTFYDTGLIKAMIKYSLPLLPNIIATWILNMSDRYIILYYCGESEVGLYGIAARFATVISFIANGVYMAYTTYAYDKKDDEDAPKQYARILNAFNFMILIICFSGSIFGKEIVAMMTEDAYVDAYVMLAPLLFSQLLYGINTLIGYAIGFAKKSKYILLSTSIGAITNVILNIILIPQYGASAAAYTTFISFMIMAVITYFISQKLYYVEYNIIHIAVINLGCFIVVVFMQEIDFIIKIICWAVTLSILVLANKSVVKDCWGLIKKS